MVSISAVNKKGLGGKKYLKGEIGCKIVEFRFKNRYGLSDVRSSALSRRLHPPSVYSLPIYTSLEVSDKLDVIKAKWPCVALATLYHSSAISL